MSRAIVTRTVPSLKSLCSDYVIDHLDRLVHRAELLYLPAKLKDRLLKRFLATQHFWRNVDFKHVLKLLAHATTRSLNLTLATVDDDVLDIVAACAGLRELFLTQHACETVSARALTRLFPRLPELRMLRLSRCAAVDDAVVACLADSCPKLAGLDLHSCGRVTSESVCKLAASDQLLWITLSNTNVCDNGIRDLVLGPSGKRLKELRLNDCSKLSNSTLQMIVENCKSLEILVFNDCGRLAGDACFGYEGVHLPQLKHVEWIIEW